MPNYTKLFSSIVTSTIWTEDDKTRIVWITMLAIADQHGEVHASIPGLARVAGVAVDDCRNAVAKLSAPDPDSRTEEFEGRRIAKIDGGWEVLNHAKYRKMASREDQKEATAKRVRRYRQRKAKDAGVTPCNADVTPCNGGVTVGVHIAEAEAEAEKDPPNPPKGGSGDAAIDLPHGPLFAEQWALWQQYRREKRKTLTPTSEKRQLAKLAKLDEDHAVATLDASITNGWQGLFPEKVEPRVNGQKRVDDCL